MEKEAIDKTVSNIEVGGNQYLLNGIKTLSLALNALAIGSLERNKAEGLLHALINKL